MPISNPSTALVAKAGDTMTGALNWAATQTIASATTTDIGAATSNSVIVSGTTTITGLGTIAAGAERVVQFSGALTLTHNATSLILPGSASITTAAGDVAYFVSLGSGNWRCTGYQKANGQAVVASGTSSDTHLLYNSSGAVVGNAALRAKVTTGSGNFANSDPRLYIGQAGSCVALSYQSAYGGLVVVNEAGTSTANLLAALLSSDYAVISSYARVSNGGYIASTVWETYHGMRVRMDGHYAFSSTTSETGTPDVAFRRDAANRASVIIPGASYGDLKLRSLISSGGFVATDAAAPTIASASTIAPAKQVSFVSGTTTISTITAPSPISAGGGQITLIPTGLWSTDTAGNIALATTAVVSKALILTYDTTTGKWYPSY